MRLKMHEIREIIRLIDESDIQEFKLDSEGSKLFIKKAALHNREVPAAPQVEQVQAPSPAAEEPVLVASAPTPQPQVEEAPAPAAAPASEAEDKDLHAIVSPMVGTFYRAPAPDAAPYVDVGQKVDEKTVVCIVEAMKLMNEIEAEVRGEIVKVLVENGELVEYGQPLFLVKTT